MTYFTETSETRTNQRKRLSALRRLREEISPELIRITDPRAVKAMPKHDLVEQVSFILGEMLHRYSFKLSGKEIREMAQALSNELVVSCTYNQEPRTIN